MKLIIPLFIIILFSFTLVSAQLDIGEENIDSVGVNILKQPQVFNNGTAFVNASNYWITSEGILGDVSDILHNWLSNLEWSVAGHTMDADLDMNQNDIIDVRNLTASWFNGKFNWTSISNFLIFDGSSLDYNETALNESIDARTTSRYYNATTIDTIEGTYDSGDIYSINIPEDGDTYNVSEDVGANPLLINVNFTNISDFNMIVGRIYYKGGSGHEIQLEIYRVDTEVWENYEEYTDMTAYVNIHVPIFDGSKHIDATGNVSVRFDHFQNGLPNHEFSIDYLNLVDGWTTLTTADHDGLSGRDLITNHPQYLDTDATRNVTGNLTVEQNLFVDGNATIAGMTISNDGTKTTFLGKTGDYNRIGDAGTTTHSLNSEDDLLVTDDFEVIGNSYFGQNAAFDNAIVIADDKTMVWGSDFDSYMKYNTLQQIADSLMLALPTTSHSIIVVDVAVASRNYDHTNQANPTIYVQSSTDPDTDNTQWLSLTHDQTNGVIETGKGYLEIRGNESSSSNISLYVEKNISATGYITRTSIFDKLSGSPFDFIQDSNYYLDKDKINHSKFYGYAGEFKVTDYDKFEIERYVTDSCEEILIGYTEEFIEECSIGLFDKINCVNITNSIPNYEYVNCIKVIEERKVYPYKKMEEGVELGAEIDVLRQAVYELNERVKYLEANCVLK